MERHAHTQTDTQTDKTSIDQCSVVRRSSRQHSRPFYTTLHCNISFHNILNHTPSYHTMLHNTVPYHSMECLRFILRISWTEKRTNGLVLQSAGTDRRRRRSVPY